MVYQKDVTREDHREPRRVNRRSDRRSFKRSANNERSINSPSGRPMRGGIRL